MINLIKREIKRVEQEIANTEEPTTDTLISLGKEVHFYFTLLKELKYYKQELQKHE